MSNNYVCTNCGNMFKTRTIHNLKQNFRTFSCICDNPKILNISYEERLYLGKKENRLKRLHHMLKIRAYNRNRLNDFDSILSKKFKPFELLPTLKPKKSTK